VPPAERPEGVEQSDGDEQVHAQPTSMESVAKAEDREPVGAADRSG
jgi:hypothetical protein